MIITRVSCHNCWKQSTIMNKGGVVFCPCCGEIAVINSVLAVPESYDYNQIKDSGVCSD